MVGQKRDVLCYVVYGLLGYPLHLLYLLLNERWECVSWNQINWYLLCVCRMDGFILCPVTFRCGSWKYNTGSSVLLWPTRHPPKPSWSPEHLKHTQRTGLSASTHKDTGELRGQMSFRNVLGDDFNLPADKCLNDDLNKGYSSELKLKLKRNFNKC